MANGGFVWHEGDYLRDTSHLTDMEDLAYRRLLGAYHSRGGPLPNDPDKICRIAKLEPKHVLSVIEEFFTVEPDGMLHQRGADRRIRDRQAFVAEQTRKAKLGAAARWKDARGHDSDARGHDSGMPGGCPPSPSPSPSPFPTQKDPPTPTGGDDKFFLEFWSMYPKKVGKGAAERSWRKIKGDKDKLLDQIGVALGWQCASENWKKDNGQYVPNPSTYLNQRRWEDGKELEL